MNNLKNLALACHNFESSQSHFPPGVGLAFDYGPAGDKDERYHPAGTWRWAGQGSLGNAGSYYGWAWYLAPYYEQNAVYQLYQTGKLTFWGGTNGLDDSGQLGNEKILSLHICPSDEDSNLVSEGYYDTSPNGGPINQNHDSTASRLPPARMLLLFDGHEFEVDFVFSRDNSDRIWRELNALFDGVGIGHVRTSSR